MDKPSLNTMSIHYRDLKLADPGRVRERLDPLQFPYSERHLQCVWFDDRWRPDRLKTSRGEPIQVKSPGRWNLEAGPDFLDAIIVVGTDRRTVRGDVEVHVRPESWVSHGHHQDPRYQSVILHLTYFPGDLPPDVLPRESETCVLKPAISRDSAFSFECIDVTAYPFTSCPAGASACRQVVAGWSPEKQVSLLESAGRERLRLKTRRFESRLTEQAPTQVFYEETMGALGYKHNRSPFRQLAQRVPLGELRQASQGEPLTAYAILLGVAGLLPPRLREEWDHQTRDFVRSLWDAWWKRRSSWQPLEMDAHLWYRSGQRPHNHPVRRLAAAAGLFGVSTPPLDLLPPLPPDTPARHWFSLAATGLREQMKLPYWLHRLTLGGHSSAKPVLLMGPRRLAALLTNVVVPFLSATGGDVDDLLPCLPREEDNSCIRQMGHTLFGRDHNPKLYNKGLHQQGLLQIFHDFCLTNRQGCTGCRLLRALKRHESRQA